MLACMTLDIGDTTLQEVEQVDLVLCFSGGTEVSVGWWWSPRAVSLVYFLLSFTLSTKLGWDGSMLSPINCTSGK